MAAGSFGTWQGAAPAEPPAPSIARQGAMALHLDLVTARLFVPVVEGEGIARAAKRETIAPPTVSKRISELELRLSGC